MAGHRCLFAFEQAMMVLPAERIATQQAVLAQMPKITRLGDGTILNPVRLDLVGRIRRRLIEAQVEFVHLCVRESRNRDIKAFTLEKGLDFRELDRQNFGVPASAERNAVVRKRKTAFLKRRKALKD